MEDFAKVATTSDLEDGEIMLVQVGEERILLSKAEGDEVECPWHGSKFNLRTGEATEAPATVALQRYAVRVEGDDILVGPA